MNTFSTRELLIVDETITDGEIRKAGGNLERSITKTPLGSRTKWVEKPPRLDKKTKVTNELANEFANRPVRFKHRGNYHPDFLIRPLCPSSSIQTRVQKA